MESLLSVVSYHIHAVYFGLLLLLGIGLVVRAPAFLGRLANSPVKILTGLVALAVCSVYLAWTVIYLVRPVYVDHVGPAVAISAAMLIRGEAVYPAWQAGEGLYGIIYGPVLYIAHAAILLITKSIVGTKLAGVIAVWVALVAMAWETRKVSRDNVVTLLVMGSVAFMLTWFNYSSYYNRPEPFLFLFVALAISALSLPRFYAALAIGLLAGLAFGVKIHGMIFVAPAAAALLFRERDVAAWLRQAVIIGLVATLVAVLPFLLPNISLGTYLAYIGVSTEQKLTLWDFHRTAAALGIMVAPGIVILFLRRPVWPLSLTAAAVFFALCCVTVLVIGSKEGAGPHHALPLIPMALYLTLHAVAAEPRWLKPDIDARAVSSLLLVVFLVTYLPYAIHGSNFWREAPEKAEEREAVIQEVRALYAAYPEAQMGVAVSRASYKRTYYRILGVLDGTPMSLDVPFLMDIISIGRGYQETEALLSDCRIPEWIVPRNGEPFAMVNFYRADDGSDVPLFSEEFRERFKRDYRPVHETSYFTVWSCR